MRTDTVEFWNNIWSTMADTFADYDDLLAVHTEGLKPGRALELGCGSGGNAVWLAERGWRVTAVDFSEAAIRKAGERARERKVDVEFLVSDVTRYRPEGLYQLITSFYIQLWPDQRAEMLSRAAKALAPGGRLLFVSHDRSSPPSGWSREDLLSLTTPTQVAAELRGLRIELAEVVEDIHLQGGHHSGAAELGEDGDDEGHDHSPSDGDSHEHGAGATTVVVAVRDE